MNEEDTVYNRWSATEFHVVGLQRNVLDVMRWSVEWFEYVEEATLLISAQILSNGRHIGDTIAGVVVFSGVVMATVNPVGYSTG